MSSIKTGFLLLQVSLAGLSGSVCDNCENLDWIDLCCEIGKERSKKDKKEIAWDRFTLKNKIVAKKKAYKVYKHAKCLFSFNKSLGKHESCLFKGADQSKYRCSQKTLKNRLAYEKKYISYENLKKHCAERKLLSGIKGLDIKEIAWYNQLLEKQKFIKEWYNLSYFFREYGITQSDFDLLLQYAVGDEKNVCEIFKLFVCAIAQKSGIENYEKLLDMCYYIPSRFLIQLYNLIRLYNTIKKEPVYVELKIFLRFLLYNTLSIANSKKYDSFTTNFLSSAFLFSIVLYRLCDRVGLDEKECSLFLEHNDFFMRQEEIDLLEFITCSFCEDDIDDIIACWDCLFIRYKYVCVFQCIMCKNICKILFRLMKNCLDVKIKWDAFLRIKESLDSIFKKSLPFIISGNDDIECKLLWNAIQEKHFSFQQKMVVLKSVLDKLSNKPDSSCRDSFDMIKNFSIKNGQRKKSLLQLKTFLFKKECALLKYSFYLLQEFLKKIKEKENCKKVNDEKNKCLEDLWKILTEDEYEN